MTFTPTTKGSFFAGVGLWLLLWASLFKLDEILADTHLKYFVSSERSIAWINRHRSASLLGTELVNYGTRDQSTGLGGVRYRRHHRQPGDDPRRAAHSLAA